jgi:hypothetical protein
MRNVTTSEGIWRDWLFKENSLPDRRQISFSKDSADCRTVLLEVKSSRIVRIAEEGRTLFGCPFYHEDVVIHYFLLDSGMRTDFGIWVSDELSELGRE